MTLRELLSADPLARLEHETADASIRTRFAGRIPDGAPVLAFRPFVDDAPWRYWDDHVVDMTVGLLETDPSRSIAAIHSRSEALDRGIDALFRPSRRASEEEGFGTETATALVTLATEWIPEYLRLAEQVFGNLIEPIWAAAKRGGRDGRFDLRGATHLMVSRGLGNLTEGFSEEVRNAIAHGKTRLTAFDIEFGAVNPVRLTRLDFLERLDILSRTCNALALGVVLFVARHRDDVVAAGRLPRTIATRFAAGAINRMNCRVVGAVESETPLAGRQLHVAVEMTERNRAHVLGQCSRIAYQLTLWGATHYERLAFEVHHGEAVASLVIVRPSVLRDLVDQGAAIDRLSSAFEETQLLWYDEPAWRTRLRGWRVIVSSALRRARHQIVGNWRAAGLWIGKGRFRLREIRNLSVDGTARVQLVAVLLRPEDANDLAIVNEIIHELVKTGRRRLVASRTGGLDRGIGWLKRPVYVWVDLYRSDGTLRWLKGGGWPKGNLIAVAERTWRGRNPIKVTNPECVHKKIRLRYRMDDDAAREAMSQVSDLFSTLGARARDRAAAKGLSPTEPGG